MPGALSIYGPMAYACESQVANSKLRISLFVEWTQIRIVRRALSRLRSHGRCAAHTSMCPEHRMSITVVAGIMHVKRFHSIAEYELVFQTGFVDTFRQPFSSSSSCSLSLSGSVATLTGQHRPHQVCMHTH